ncbi:hypothetical protein [Sphingobacterium tabacisoli]|uniref:Uncharacterized protein n=1 Tax=Sphingobacterium tabacisoli TaxID=2044855 RepID=A0ABW5L7E1_9SPHI|nr:hypothetical protein [Sphingobacterium tabacisoli]
MIEKNIELKSAQAGSWSKCLIVFGLWLSLFNMVLAQQDRYLVEAESFQFKGKWFVDRHRDCFAGGMLRVAGGGTNDPSADALTFVDIREAGRYGVWVRSADYNQNPGTRLFQLSVDENPMEIGGKHGKEGFLWEKVGSIELAKKRVLLRLHDSNQNFGRCDAILLSKDESLDPNVVDRQTVGKWRKNPTVATTMLTSYDNLSTSLPLKDKATVIAKVENKEIRLSFVRGGLEDKAILCKTEIKVNGQWRQYLEKLEDHKVFLIKANANTISYPEFFPAWDNSILKQSFEHEGKTLTVQDGQDRMNPYGAGQISEAIPVGVKTIDDRTIEVQYLTKDRSSIVGYWQLPENGSFIETSFLSQVAENGMYSLSLAAFQGVSDNKVSNVLAPPMFQYKRIPARPQMLLSNMMQQPLTIVETKTEGQTLSAFICADLSSFANDWGSSDHAAIGFSLRSPHLDVQPVAFAPVLGMADSKVAKGDLLESKFIIGLMPTGWQDAVAYISDHIFKVRDYRKQEQGSLTDAMFNMTDLLLDDNAGGWSASLKGYYDIEGNPGTAPTVVHATPLAVVAGAIVGQDEEFYLKRALPTIEYTLSRSGYRWAKDIVPDGYNRTAESLKLGPFNSQFNTSYYEGLNAMLGNLNPWLKEIAMAGDTLRKTSGYSVPTLSWVQALSAYRLTGQKKWLEEAKVTATRYIDQQIYTNSNKPLSKMPFYNTTFYAPWWDLIDLYEETKDRKFLNAAQYGAAHTLAGIRSYPQVADSMQTIHPGNQYEGNTNLWWKDKEKYRLGYPRKDGDVLQKQVEAQLVSPVGLGFEQPSTYFLTAKGKRVRPVFMSSWAPHLLRLYQYTQKEIYQTYARNAVIGRYTNYPGYYATGYTDITLHKDFPYKGPDVSSIYYHHIPPHWAFTWDYLVTEAIQRSKGKISFPYSKQEGFVWFANRIYHGKGKIFDDNDATLWMRRGMVEVNTDEVNYVTAVSDKNFWVVLNSEAAKDMEVSVKVKTVDNISQTRTAVVYQENGTHNNVSLQDGELNVLIPAKGIRAIAIPLAVTAQQPLEAPLKKGMQVLDLGSKLGKVYVFRIRSPFGWDSIYAYAESAPLDNALFRVLCNGEKKEVNTYPFENSFYKLAVDQPIHIQVSGTVDGKEIGAKETVFK